LVENENRVYLTHINTPNEVMIAGDPAGCERVIAQLNADSMKAPFSVVIHADVMMGEYSEFYNLHNLPVTPVPDVKLYSAADYAPLTQAREVVANNISRMACKQIDFPRLIRNAYQDGARAFIELGPRSTAARWINETLGDLPHVAVSIDNMASDSRTSLVRALAQFVAHRVPMNLSALYNAIQPANEKSLIRKVQPGGMNIYNAIQAGLGDIPTADTQTPAPVAQIARTSATPLPEGIHGVHSDFLQSRKAGLRGIADLITQQIEAFKSGNVSAGQAPAQASIAPTTQTPAQPTLPPPPAPNPLTAPSIRDGIEPLYPYEAIDTFALRRIADTFGERYAIYDGRRAPRIPNGDLLLISRVVKIEGERYKPGNKTNILAEYDVPVDAWFYEDAPYPTMPYSVLMEIALQPCGILSAYHGPTFAYPDADLYFRNLDGDGKLIKDRDMRGRTITNHVTMLSHASIGGSILQKYSFDLYDDGELFYTGTAVFGYFTSESLASRAGLDAGQSRDRWIDTEQPANVDIISAPQTIGNGYLRLGNRQLDLIHEARVVLDGGHYGKGYAYARTDIDAGMWFFKNHFHQDPVMPGSIGVETMLEALQSFAIHSGLTTELPDGHFAHPDASNTPDGHKVDWRYRGQVLGTFKATHVEVNVKEIRRSENEIVIIADGSLWRENLRIYEVNNLGLAIRR
jgi:3-hydroxymyristoyl/3-hydroxydecanoyl-(acyl carrier protein) dehydratase